MKTSAESEMSPETWLIRQDKIRPGDVLLTKGGSFISKAISHFDEGNFSHAAVCISPFNVFESYDFVEHAWMKPVGLTNEDGVPVTWCAVPHDPELAELWRHPDIAQISESRFNEVYSNMMYEYWGLDYSLYVRLIPLANAPEELKNLGSFFANLYDQYVEKSKTPGPFCSELVKLFYDRLPLKLFAQERPAKEVSPNALASSLLVRVHGVVFQFKNTKGISITPLEDEVMFESFKKASDAASVAMRGQRIQMRTLEEFLDRMRAAGIRLDNVDSDSLNIQAGLIKKIIESAVSLPMPVLHKNVSNLVVNYGAAASSILSCLQSHPVDQSRLNEARDACDKINSSCVRLSSIIWSQQLKKIEIVWKNPKHWFRWLRRRKVRGARREILLNAREAASKTLWKTLRSRL